MSLLSKMLGIGRNEHYDRGIRLFDQGMYLEAIEAFRRVTATDGRRSDPLNERLAAFYTAESYSHLGHDALKSGHWSTAAECFSAALQIHPNYADLHFHLASAQRYSGHLEAALNSLNSAISINPRFARAHLSRGVVQYELKEYASSLHSIHQAVELEPGFQCEAMAQFNAHNDAGEHERALRQLELVCHTEIDDILFHYKLGDDLYRRALYSEAVQEYQKALTLNPEYADIRNHMGMAFQVQGLLNEAIAEFEHALAINPRFSEAMVNLGTAYQENGDVAQAAQMYSRVLAIEPDNPVALAGIATARREAA